MKRHFLLLAIIVLGVTGVRAQMVETSAKISISRDSIMIGDTLTMYVDVEHDMATILSIPTFNEGKMTERLEIASGPEVDTIFADGRRQNVRLKYVITSFDAGGIILDSFPLLQGKTEPFDTVFARGGSLLSIGTFEIDTLQDKPFAIHGTLNAPYSWGEFVADFVANWHWFVVILVVIIATIFGVVYFRRRALRRELRRIPLPPHIVAMAALDKIYEEKIWQEGKMKEYFSSVTDTLRVYIDGRYGVGAMEMTSGEIMAAIKDFKINDRLTSSLRALLDISDLAKFAKAIPSDEECEEVYNDARFFVEQTKEIEIIEEEKPSEQDDEDYEL